MGSVLFRGLVFHTLSPSNRDQNRNSQNGTVTKTVLPSILARNILERDGAMSRVWVGIDELSYSVLTYNHNSV